MDGTLAAIAAAGLAVYVVTSMLTLGLASGRSGLSTALRDRGRMAGLVVAGAVAAPLGAWALGAVVGLDLPLRVGLLLLGAAAGPPALGALGRRLGDGGGLPAGHTALLTGLAVVVTPLLLVGLVTTVEVRASDVLLPLAAGVVLPLVGGLVARTRDEEGVARLLPTLERLTLGALAVGGGLAVLLALPVILRTIGTGAALALVSFGAVCVAAGALLGARQPGRGAAFAVCTLQRNLPVAALLAITTFRGEPVVLAMVVGGVVLLRVLQLPFAAGEGSRPKGLPASMRVADPRQGRSVPRTARRPEDVLTR
jgi:predicted Na+-dependent transporter